MTAPLWGAMIRSAREAAGLSIREAARRVQLSDSYWGQVEKGYQVRGGERQPFVPVIGTLLHIGRALRMTEQEVDALVAAAGYAPLPAARTRPHASAEVDTSGLSREDVRLLNAFAARLRQVGEVAELPRLARRTK